LSLSRRRDRQVIGPVQQVSGAATRSAKGGRAGTSPPAQPSTTNWYQQYFPAGTNFGLTSNPNAPWTAFSWTYNAPRTCEMWTDAYNNGAGNGTYAADGNIAGINQCA